MSDLTFQDPPSNIYPQCLTTAIFLPFVRVKNTMITHKVNRANINKLKKQRINMIITTQQSQVITNMVQIVTINTKTSSKQDISMDPTAITITMKHPNISMDPIAHITTTIIVIIMNIMPLKLNSANLHLKSLFNLKLKNL